MDINKKKAVVSTVLIISGLMSYITGAVLYFFKTGRILLFPRWFIKNIHVASTVTMGITVLYHFYLNRKIYKSEINALKSKKNKK